MAKSVSHGTGSAMSFHVHSTFESELSLRSSMRHSVTQLVGSAACVICSPFLARSFISYLLGHLARTLVASNVLSALSEPSTVTETSMSGTSRKVSGTTHCGKRTGSSEPLVAMVKSYSQGLA